MISAENIRLYWGFVPRWDSHRYRYLNQIVYSTGATWHSLRYYRWYWILTANFIAR